MVESEEILPMDIHFVQVTDCASQLEAMLNSKNSKLHRQFMVSNFAGTIQKPGQQTKKKKETPTPTLYLLSKPSKNQTRKYITLVYGRVK